MIDPINLFDYIFGLIRTGGKLTLVSLGDDDVPIESERVLRAFGVRMWGRHLIGNEALCYVRSGQAKWAKELLRRKAEGKLPKRQWQKNGVKPKTFVDYTLRILEGIFGI